MNKYDNSGAVFVNDKKEKDNHPDRTGQCTIDGKEYWISGWIKSGAKGQFMSLAFKPKEAKNAPSQEPVRKSGKAADDLGDIPW
jgi:hypothetical protein